MTFLDELAARRRFGMKPGLEAIRGVSAALGNPERRFKAVHVAGTNGKGAVCALLDAVFAGAGGRTFRYTSPHLVRLNERFCLNGRPVDDATLDRAAARVASVAPADLTFFEALTAVAFLLAADAAPERVILETGLGGRLDATNVCEPELCVITKIGLDHCDWLGDTVEKIAAEKAGIVKPGVPVVLGLNAPSVRRVVEARAKAVGAPFHYAPDLVAEEEIPADFALPGSFNRENAQTAAAAVKVLYGDVPRAGGDSPLAGIIARGFKCAVWPGRYQKVGNFIVDGAHNPPAAEALSMALDETGGEFDLIAGFCADKDVDEVLRILSRHVRKGYAVRTNSPRSLSAEETALKMKTAGISAESCDTLGLAIEKAGTGPALICGSLFLAGEALVRLGAYPWPAGRFDFSEQLRTTQEEKVT